MVERLQTQRLSLEPMNETDLGAIYQIFSQEEVSRFFGQDRMVNIEQARFWLDVQMRMQALGAGMAWVLRLNATGEIVGTVCFDEINHEWHNLGISYSLHPDFWHQGLMSEALAQLIGWVFSGALGEPIHRIQALVFSKNLASVKLLQQLGFVHEGQRLGLLFWQQQYWDLDSYCLINPL